MKNFLFVDTETTGIHSSARLVQLAAVLTNEDGEELSSMNMIVRPTDFEIPDQASDIHGITTAYARRVGLPLAVVLKMFSYLVFLSDYMFAHNIKFDRRILVNEYKLMGSETMAKRLDSADKKPTQVCTMRSTTDICKIPNKGRGGYKFPKLSELYEYCTGKPSIEQHSAMGDVTAMKECVFMLLTEEKLSLPV